LCKPVSAPRTPFTRTRLRTSGHTMKQSKYSDARWSTTSFGHSIDPRPMDLEALQTHVEHCKKSLQFSFVLQQSGRVLSSFLTARVVSTFLVTVLLTAALVYAW
jgi:hypothetical protein